MQTEIPATNVGFFNSFVEPIANFGVLVVIASIFLVSIILCLRKFIGTYTQTVDKTINGVIPKLEEINKSILDLNAYVNEMLSIHNARSNQSFKSIEKDTDDIKDLISECQKKLIELESDINSLKAEYETIFSIMIKNKEQ